MPQHSRAGSYAAAAAVIAFAAFCPRPAAAQTYSLVVGIDGLGSYGLAAAPTPNLDALMNGSWAGTGAGYRGSVATAAYAGGTVGTPTQQPTVSGPGWSSIHTGVWADQHGVTNNTFSGSQYAARPSYLKILESQVPGIYTAGVVSWNPINDNIFVADGVNPNLNFRLGTNENDSLTASTAAAQIAGLSGTAPGAVFVHLDDVDLAGHGSGAYSANYLTSIANSDTRVGTMLAAIKARPGFAAENWQIVVVSDHGHLAGGGHGGQTQMERTLPIIVGSKAAVQGTMPVDVRRAALVDVSATVLNHFGATVPAGQAGVPLGTAAVGPNPPAALTTGLVSHIRFDGTAQGSLPTGGGATAGSVQFVAGRFGQAATVVNYGTGVVRVNQDLGAAFGTAGDFAMSLWVKYDSFTGNPAFFSNKNWASGTNTGINLALQTAGGRTLDFNSIAAGGTRRDIEPYGGFGTGTWHHVLFNVDRDGATLLYVDGWLYGEVTQSSVGSFDGAFSWTFLNDGTGTSAPGSVNGLMVDEFGAWNRLLTQDEISYLAQGEIAPVPEPGFVLAAGLAGLAVLRGRKTGIFKGYRRGSASALLGQTVTSGNQPAIIAANSSTAGRSLA